MCGIWGFISKEICGKFSKDRGKLYGAYSLVRKRGPDRSEFHELDEFVKVFIGFHRLAIMDKTTKGDQPFVLERGNRTIYCMCNGEIYEHSSLAKKYDLQLKSKSDCEVIPLIYERFGIERLVDDIKGGEFACVIIDVYHQEERMVLHCIRDPLGIRPMFIGEDESGFAFSSELKGLIGVIDPSTIQQMPNGSYLTFSLNRSLCGKSVDSSTEIYRYYDTSFPIVRSPLSDSELLDKKNLDPVLERVRSALIHAVESMMESDRQLGALLSGGLDSSLVVSIASRFLKQHGRRLQTFSIGMPGSTDRQYAEMVAKYCDTDHTHIELTTDDFLGAIEDVVDCIESPDITTIRASTGQYLVSKIISERFGVKVLLIGDGSDELCSGYLYFHKATSPDESHEENAKLLREIMFYDVLRADRGVASNGLEARVPFLKHTFVDLIMSLDPRLRVPINGVEKWLLRMSFDGLDYLPPEVLFRRKEAFSDGVSSVADSWYRIIQRRSDEMITDEEFEGDKYSYRHFVPPNKEALYFLRLFCDKFGKDLLHIVPHYWLPNSKWVGNITEPSARVLTNYGTK